MKKLPILCSTDMVQALLDGRKTMTRRTLGLKQVNESPDDYILLPEHKYTWVFVFKNKTSDEVGHFCSVYEKGQVIWACEPFCEPVLFDGSEKDYYYKADYPDGIDAHPDSKYVTGKWTPCIHMPKAAARIWLEVTNVRCERLLDISESDAIAEGIKVIEPGEAYFDYEFDGKNGHCATARGSFFSLWISLKGKESFTNNPWVFVYEFKRIEKP